MGYGGPRDLNEVENFLRSVFGQVPSPIVLQSARKRYEAIGGSSPLVENVYKWAKLVENHLSKIGLFLKVFPGFRFSRPSIEEAIQEALEAGTKPIFSLPLTPFYSEWAYEWYRKAFISAIERMLPGQAMKVAEPYYDHPSLIDQWKALLSQVNIRPAEDFVIFSAHSLPLTDKAAMVTYPDQVFRLSSAIMKDNPIREWKVAYQSVGSKGGEWLKPELKETIKEAKGRSYKRIVIIPVGFLFENVETLFDLDIEAKDLVEGYEMEYLRLPTPGGAEGFEKVLGQIIIDNFVY